MDHLIADIFQIISDQLDLVSNTFGFDSIEK